MSITASTVRRIAAIASVTAITCTTAITTTYAASPASDITDTRAPRPCFIVQPRWNEAIDGPTPTCGVTPPPSTATSGADTHQRLHFGDENAADSGY